MSHVSCLPKMANVPHGGAFRADGLLAKTGLTSDNLHSHLDAFHRTRKPRQPGRRSMRYMKFALARPCAFGLVGLTPATAAEPVKIRMSWVAPVANWASIVLEKKDLANHMGKSYTVESARYQGTPQMITAIANNELEVSNLAYSSLAIA